MKAIFSNGIEVAADAGSPGEELSNEGSKLSTAHFSFRSGILRYPLHSGEVASAYCRLYDESFSSVVIDRSVRMFNNPWSMAFIRNALRATKLGGYLTVPVCGERVGMAKGLLSIDFLSRNFQRFSNVEMQDGLAVVSRSQLPSEFPSLAEAFLSDAACFVAEYCQVREGGGELSGGIGALNDFDEFLSVSSGSSSLKPVDVKAVQLANVTVSGAASACEYWFTGLNYKSMLIAHIIKSVVGQGPIALLDHGGGAAVLAAELLLDPGIGLKRAVCCDPNAWNYCAARRVRSILPAARRDDLKFWLGYSEAYEYDSRFNVITFIGSLLYLSRPDATVALRRAWDALEPGGVLIVHENIKSEAYRTGPDYEKMFNVDELDAMLSEFGVDVRRFLSSATIEVTREQAGEKSVFRTVSKP